MLPTDGGPQVFAVEVGERHGVVLGQAAVIAMLVKHQVAVQPVVRQGRGVQQHGHAAAIVVQAALVARETAVFGTQTGHLVLGDNALLAVKRHAVGLLVDVRLDSGSQSIVPQFVATAQTQCQVGDDAPHARVMVAVFLFGPDQHFATQEPSVEASRISAGDGVALAVRVAASRVGQDVGLQQVVVAGGVPLDAVLLAGRVGRSAPHSGAVTEAQVGVYLDVGQGVACAFFQDKGL